MAIADGIGPAVWFSVGALIMEMAYVRLSLVAMDWFCRQQRWTRLLERVMIGIIGLLAVCSFWAAIYPQRHDNFIIGFVSPAPIPRLLTGMLLSAVNPLQIPFWFGWSTVLFSKKILQHRNDHYNAYIAGIGLGTFAGNAIFIFGGRLLIGIVQTHDAAMNTVIGIIFLITAGVQFRKMRKAKPPSTYPGHPG